MGQVGIDTGENTLRKQVDEQISDKIRELEHCAAQSKEVSKGTQIQEIAAKKYLYSN
jgi:cell division protein FtsL